MIFIIIVSLAAGYLAGKSGVQVETSSSTLTVTSWQTTTLTFTSGTTMTSVVTYPAPIPIASVEVANVSIGGSPGVVAVDKATGRIYVEDLSSNVLTVINGSSNSVVARITLPADSNDGIAIDSNSNTVYVLVKGEVAVVNGTSNKVEGVFPLDFGSGTLAYDQSSHVIYGVGPPEAGSPDIIGADARNGSVVMDMALGYTGQGVAVDPFTHLVSVAGCNIKGLNCNSEVSIINGTSKKLLNLIQLYNGAYPSITIDPYIGVVYVSGSAELTGLSETTGKVIFDVDSQTCAALDTMALGVSTQVLAITHLYNYLLVYDGASGTLLNMYSFPETPQYVASVNSFPYLYATVSGDLIVFNGQEASPGHINTSLIGIGYDCPLP
jgi:DNA-binding beta-propeller fold protein YncE